MRRFLYASLLLLLLAPGSAFASVISSQSATTHIDRYCALPGATPCVAGTVFQVNRQSVDTGISGSLESIVLRGYSSSSLLFSVDLYENGTPVATFSGTSTPILGTIVLTPVTPYTLNAAYTYSLYLGTQTKDIFLNGAVTASYPATFYNYLNLPGSTAPSGASALFFELRDDVPESVPFDAATHIMSMTPENGTTTGNTVSFGLSAYLAPEDIDQYGHIRVFLKNIDQNVLLAGELSPSTIVLYDEDVSTSGVFDFATTTTLGDGNYRLYAELSGNTILGSIWNAVNYLPFADTGLETSASTQFVVNQGTFIGNISQNSYASLNSMFASTSATSTSALAQSCNVASIFTFSITDCLAFLFIPDAGLAAASIGNFRNEIMTRFPLGYVTDFVSIIASGTSTTVTLIDAEVPGILPGGGATLAIGINGSSMDWFWNATTDEFLTSKQDDPRTLYEITNDYFLVILGLSTVLYMLRRILGSVAIPEFANRGRQPALYASAETMKRARRQNTRNGVYAPGGWDR